MNLVFGLMALIGLIASLLVHLSAVLGIDVAMSSSQDYGKMA